MEQGLIWLPLLALFFGLAWAGWHEYHKFNACQTWAAEFERYKYDIAAVLGQRDRFLIWGKPTRRGPVNLQQLCLDEITGVQLNDRPLGLRLTYSAPQTPEKTIEIPFTEKTIALAWQQWLQSSIHTNL